MTPTIDAPRTAGPADADEWARAREDAIAARPLRVNSFGDVIVDPEGDHLAAAPLKKNQLGDVIVKTNDVTEPVKKLIGTNLIRQGLGVADFFGLSKTLGIEKGDELGADTTANRARAAADSATFGLSSKGIAGIEAATGNAPSYSSALADERARLQAFGDKHPVVSTIAEGAGALGTGAGLAKAGVTLVGRLPQAASLGSKIGAFAGEGAAYGAAQGAGHTDTGNVMDYIKAAMSGGAGGAALGSLLPIAGGIAGGVAKIAAPIVNDVTAAAARRGYGVPRGIASDNPVVQQAGQIAANIPGIGAPLVKSGEGFLENLGQDAQGIANAAGAKSEFGAGTSVGKEIRDWMSGPKNVPTAGGLTNSKTIVGDAYDKAEALTNPKIYSAPSETQATVGAILAKRANMVAKDPIGPAVKEVQDAIARPGGLNVQGFKDLRTSLGQKVDNSLLPHDWDKAELDQLYGALTKDYEAAILKSGGQPAAAAYARANAIQRSIAGRREALADIVGASGDKTGEQIFANIKQIASSRSTGDLSLLAKARQVVGPQAWEELSGTIINGLGRNAEGEFSPRLFIGKGGFNGLSDAGKAILFGKLPGGDLRQPLEDIATLSSRWKHAERFANTSKTSQFTALAAIVAGLKTEPLTTLGTILGSRWVAKVLSNPATATSAARWASAYNRLSAAPSPGTLAALVSSTRNFTSTAASKIGSTLTPEHFLDRLIGGRVPAFADQGGAQMTSDQATPEPAPQDGPQAPNEGD